ncbi:hypothetical protein TNCV_386581 [Trichonephila clavipes]|nr:hypothetical protein TNCV_386581 [Trichonephila clavipes]
MPTMIDTLPKKLPASPTADSSRRAMSYSQYRYRPCLIGSDVRFICRGSTTSRPCGLEIRRERAIFRCRPRSSLDNGSK